MNEVELGHSDYPENGFTTRNGSVKCHTVFFWGWGGGALQFNLK